MDDPNRPPPIVVNANPATDQAAALLRTALVATGSVAAAFGLAKASGQLALIASLAGPIVTAISAAIALTAFIWGQLKTRLMAQKAAAMARALPNDIAHTK